MTIEFDLEYSDSARMRPPKVQLFFGLRIRNSANAGQWVLIPDQLPRVAGAGTRVLSIDQYLLPAPVELTVAHCVGTAGCFALTVPAGGEIQLRRLPIAFWGEPPDSLEVELVYADELLIDGTPAGQRLPISPGNKSGMCADAAGLANQAAVRAALTGELEITTAGEHHTTLRVGLG